MGCFARVDMIRINTQITYLLFSALFVSFVFGQQTHANTGPESPECISERNRIRGQVDQCAERALSSLNERERNTIRALRDADRSNWLGSVDRSNRDLAAAAVAFDRKMENCLKQWQSLTPACRSERARSRNWEQVRDQKRQARRQLMDEANITWGDVKLQMADSPIRGPQHPPGTTTGPGTETVRPNAHNPSEANRPTTRYGGLSDSDPTRMQMRRQRAATAVSMIKEIQKLGKRDDDDVEAFARRQEALYRAEQKKEKRTGGTVKNAPVARAVAERESKRGGGQDGDYVPARPQPLPQAAPGYAGGSPAQGSEGNQSPQSILPEDDPLPPIPVAQRLPASSDFGDMGDDFGGEGTMVASYTPPAQYNEYERKKKEDEHELKELPSVQLAESETVGKAPPVEGKKAEEEKKEKGFFGKLSDTVFNFFGFGDDEEENASRTPEEVLADKQFDPLAKPEDGKNNSVLNKSDKADETLKSEKWFGQEKEHNPEAKPENTEAYKVADPVFEEGKEAKTPDVAAQEKTEEKDDEKMIEKQNQDLPVIVLSGQPQFDPTKVADQIREIEKREVKRSMASKTLEELAAEANLQRSVPLEDTYIEEAPLTDEYVPEDGGMDY